MSLTNRTRLHIGTPPSIPPWRFIDPRTLCRWVNVSTQTLVNWRMRGTGPDWCQSKNTRIWYQSAAVAAWLDGPKSPSATRRIRDFLADHERQAGEALWRLPGVTGSCARHALARINTIDSDTLERLCLTLDNLGLFGTPTIRPKAFVAVRRMDALIGYAS